MPCFCFPTAPKDGRTVSLPTPQAGRSGGDIFRDCTANPVEGFPDTRTIRVKFCGVLDRLVFFHFIWCVGYTRLEG